MRGQPSFGGSLVTVLKPGALLLVLDSPDAAQKKIGVVNQWLHVRDVEGHEGYVAAWYVRRSPLAQFPQEAVEDTQPLSVYVSRRASRGLRLRSAPTTASSVVKVLPPHAHLLVLDPREEAESKIGKQGAWLHVRDVADEEGYVAAWYVVR
jgi:hypothetical protein